MKRRILAAVIFAAASPVLAQTNGQAVTSGRPVKGVSPAVLNYALEVMAR